MHGHGALFCRLCLQRLHTLKCALLTGWPYSTSSPARDISCCVSTKAGVLVPAVAPAPSPALTFTSSTSCLRLLFTRALHRGYAINAFRKLGLLPLSTESSDEHCLAEGISPILRRLLIRPPFHSSTIRPPKYLSLICYLRVEVALAAAVLRPRDCPDPSPVSRAPS